MRPYVLLAALFLAGCSCIRLSVGVGVGVGANLRVGVADVGAGGGVGYEWGCVYGVLGRHLEGELAVPVLMRTECIVSDEERVARLRFEGAVPAIMRLADAAPAGRDYLLTSEAEVAASLWLGFVSVHIGFDPARAAGRDGPGVRYEPRTAPKPGSRTSYSFIDEAEGAAQLDLLLDDPVRLVRVRSGEVELWVSPRLALLVGVAPGGREALADEHARRGSRSLAAAIRARDVDGLWRAISDAPFAPEAPAAARLLGGLLLEAGDFEGASEAFWVESAASGGDAAADGRLAFVRSLGRSATAERGPIVEAPDAVPVLRGLRLAPAPGGALRATATDGSVAWVRSDVLSRDETFVRAIGTGGGLAFFVTAVAAGPARKSVVAVDDEGAVRWRRELPLPSFLPWRFAICGPRLIAVSRSDALSFDQASGRIEWFWHRNERELPSIVPMDCRPILRPRLDGPELRVADGVLEWRTDAFQLGYGDVDRLERVDVVTGLEPVRCARPVRRP